MHKILITTFCLLLTTLCAVAHNLRGIVLDAQTGDSIPRVTVTYRGHHLSVVTGQNGHFTIPRHNGWKLTFTAVGYKSQNLSISENSKDYIVIRLRTDVRALNEVVVKSKKRKYSRKDNPAVAFMKRVIAAKKQNKLEVNSYYQYRNYEKLTIALNELSEHALDSGIYAKKEYLRKQVEKNPITDKYVLPVITTEKVSRYYYRQDPKDEKTIVEAEKESGINDLIETVYCAGKGHIQRGRYIRRTGTHTAPALHLADSQQCYQFLSLLSHRHSEDRQRLMYLCHLYPQQPAGLWF